MLVNREELLQKLEMVQPGLSTRDIVNQGNCIIFSKGKILTYNDEIFCCLEEPSIKFEGAVRAEPLLALMRKMKDDEVDVGPDDDHKFFVIKSVKGRKKTASIIMEAEVGSQFKSVETPGKWKNLHEEFLSALSIVQQCAGKDVNKYALTCVHIHPKWVEACDGFHVSRFNLKTGFEQSVLLSKDAVKQIGTLGVTKFSVTETWMHFKNSAGLIVSCRTHNYDYPNMTDKIKISGDPLTLPKGLKDSIDIAENFSAATQDENLVQVDLKEGKMRLTGRGTIGWYSETFNAKYDGPGLSFYIPPAILAEVVTRHNECEVTEDNLKVSGVSWIYITCLARKAKETK